MTMQTSKTEPKRYRVERITDIFGIPEESIDDFLVDLKSFYQLGKPMAKLVDEIAALDGLKTETVPQFMIWIDDGKHDARLVIKPMPPKTKGEIDE